MLPCDYLIVVMLLKVYTDPAKSENFQTSKQCIQIVNGLQSLSLTPSIMYTVTCTFILLYYCNIYIVGAAVKSQLLIQLIAN